VGYEPSIRTDSAFGYSKTPQAQQLGAQMVTAIGKTFGEIS